MSTTIVLGLRGDKFPISQEDVSRPWDDNWSTTSVLGIWRDKFPISQEDFLVQETTTDWLLRYSTFGGTNSLSQEDTLIYKTTTCRLLQYSAFGGTSSLSLKKIFLVHEMTTDRLLWYSTFRETSSLSMSTRPLKRQILYFPRGIIIHSGRSKITKNASVWEP